MPSPKANRIAFESALDQYEIKYQELDGNGRIGVRVTYNLKNVNHLTVSFLFDEDGEDVHFVAGVITHVPEGDARRGAVLEALNDANRRFRWIKFYLDQDSDIMADGDHILTPDFVGNTCHTLLERILSVCDQAYPDFMRAIWS